MTAALGLQWGDESKGKLVDVLSADVDICMFCTDRNNAGHMIVMPVEPEGVLKTFVFHLLPSGVYMILWVFTYFVSIHVFRPVESCMHGSDWVWHRCSFAISLH